MMLAALMPRLNDGIQVVSVSRGLLLPNEGDANDSAVVKRQKELFGAKSFEGFELIEVARRSCKD
jgi:hypothetical protein